jgi:hypothetical protein
MAAATAAMIAAFAVVDGSHRGVAGYVAVAVGVAAFTSYGAVGAAVVSRFPRHRLGWLLCSASFSVGISCGLNAYTDLGQPRGWPLLVPAEVLIDVGWICSLGLVIVFLGLLIPDGELPSPRWRPVAACGFVVLGLAVAGSLFRAELGPGRPNPIGLAIASHLQTATQVGLVPMVVAGIVATTVRYRRSGRVERLQLKWILGSFVAVIGISVIDGVLSSYVIDGYDGLPEVLQFGVWAGIPAGFAVAIFRYRLYEIDVLIRRTLVYASLVAVLAILYLGAITLLGAASRAATGQNGTLAVTLSTLLVAAAFQPLRGRIQRAVDRRFYRARYDAERTLEAFSGRLRDELDVDQLGGEVTALVSDTLRPAHVSLWLRA